MDQVAMPTSTPRLDDMLTREQAEQWLQLSEKELRLKSTGARPEIVPFRIGHKTVRFHPRTIITVLAERAGVAPETISRSFGIQVARSENR